MTPPSGIPAALRSTDEDPFAALPPTAVAIHVGPGANGAHFRVPDVRAVREFLRTLLTA